MSQKLFENDTSPKAISYRNLAQVLPCGGSAPITVEDLVELPYTGFNHLPYPIAAALLATLAGMLIALRKKNLKLSEVLDQKLNSISVTVKLI